MTEQGKHLVSKIENKKVVFWSPRESAILLGISPLGAKDLMQHQHEGDEVEHAGFLWVDGHWLAFRICLDKSRVLKATFSDGLRKKACLEMIDLTNLCAVALDAGDSCETYIEQHGGHHCGVIAVYNLGRALGRWNQEVDEADLITCHKILLHRQNRVGHGSEHHDLAVQWKAGHLRGGLISFVVDQTKGDIALWTMLHG